MQPNFAFEPAPTQEMLPGPKRMDYRSPKPDRYEKGSPAAARDDDAHRSFEATLREARKSQAETGRQERADKASEAPEEPGQSHRETDNEKCSIRSDSDDSQAGGGDEADHGSEHKEDDLSDQLPATGNGNEEEADHELTGAEGIIMAAGIPATAEMATGATLTAEAASAGGGGDFNFPDIAGDLKPSDSGTDLSAPKPGFTGLSNHVAVADGEKAQLSAESTNAAATGLQKDEPVNILNSAGANETSAADSVKSFEDLVRSETLSARTGKLKAVGQSEGIAGAGAKAKTEGPLNEQAMLSKHLQAGQNALNQNTQDAKATAPDEAPRTKSGEVSSDQPGAARVNGELLQTREADGKLDAVSGEEAGPKLAKVTAGSKDTAFMHQQDQNFERLMEPTGTTREKEGSPGAWRAQTLEQIVSRAVYHLKNGQNSVRIDLKPEFLGQVRMQIVTVEQQVSVRITAELPVVKEMLDNNLQQLKADLQQQGLEVDDIEVSVSTDSQHNAHNRRMRFEEMASGDASVDEENAAESAPVPNAVSSSRLSDSAVDMFV